MTSPQSLGRVLAATAATLLLLVGPASAARTTPAHIEGETGPGSLYVIDVPADWNGDLVLYAHGIVRSSAPVVPPSTQDGYAALRDALLAEGYAVAASSFSENGWAFRDAVQRTHQLVGIFKSKVGRPDRIYLMGHSFGGLVITKLAERYPGQYDGALAMCGVLGGAVAEIQYAGDLRVIFDHFFPGLLPGEPFAIPDVPFVPPSPAFPAGSPLFQQVFAALNDPQNAPNLLAWAFAANIPFNLAGLPATLGTAAFTALIFQWTYTNDLIAVVNGKIPYDNMTTEYEVDVPLFDAATNAFLTAQLNAGVERIPGDPAAFNFYEHNYVPTGDLAFPMLTLHGMFDPAVPIFHEALYLQKVQEAGNAEWLVQRTTQGASHCGFSTGEMLGAFTDLVAWVEDGTRPQP